MVRLSGESLRCIRRPVLLSCQLWRKLGMLTASSSGFSEVFLCWFSLYPHLPDNLSIAQKINCQRIYNFILTYFGHAHNVAEYDESHVGVFSLHQQSYAILPCLPFLVDTIEQIALLNNLVL